jgi:hypothetical protein
METRATAGVARLESDLVSAASERQPLDARLTDLSSPTSDATEASDHLRGNRPATRPALVVRPVRLGDLSALGGLHSLPRLDQPDSLLAPIGAVRAGVNAVTPFVRNRPRVFVALNGRAVVGFARFEAILPDQRWVLGALGFADDGPDPADVVEALITRAVVFAGRNGVKRLFARVDSRSELCDLLRQIGFVAFTSETILVGHDLTAVRPPASLQRQDASDTWAIHQLYNAAVPRQVQYAEAYTSHRWDLDPKRRRERVAGVSGWLIAEGHHVVGYARIASARRCDVLELVFHPERLDVLDDLIQGALARAVSGRRVYCTVRAYQAEAITALERAGFQVVMEQDVYLKYTTANVRLPVFESVPLHVEVRDKLPKRVPTFLHGQPQDETAT